VAEIDEHIYSRTIAPEITEDIIFAANVFRQDVGRYPTPAEMLADCSSPTSGSALTDGTRLGVWGSGVRYPKDWRAWRSVLRGRLACGSCRAGCASAGVSWGCARHFSIRRGREVLRRR
jgi:hypothetical protein